MAIAERHASDEVSDNDGEEMSSSEDEFNSPLISPLKRVTAFGIDDILHSNKFGLTKDDALSFDGE